MKTDYQNTIPSDRILYSNCWEDADLLLQALNPSPEDTVLAIVSAGDSCFSLLSQQPKAIFAYDLSRPQLFLVELKKEAFRQLDYPELLTFLGAQPGNERVSIFNNRLLPDLGQEAAVFWKEHLDWIAKGVLKCGRLEGYFRRYRKYVQPLLASPQTIQAFFAGPASPQQRVRYRRKIANPLVKVLMRTFLSRPVMSLTGRTPAFFTEVDVNVGAYLYERFREFLEEPEGYDNPYIHWLSTGHYGAYLPHYLRPESFAPIRNNLDRLQLREGNLREGIKSHPEATLMHGSDIFEYMPREEFHEFGLEIVESLPNLKRLAYWNLMVDRVFADDLSGYFRSLPPKWSQNDRLFFYKRFVFEAPKNQNK